MTAPACPPTRATDGEALDSVFRAPATARLFVIGFTVAAAFACFDQKLLSWRYDLTQGQIAFCQVLLVLLLLSDREGRMRSRLIATAIAAVATVAFGLWAAIHRAVFTPGFLFDLTFAQSPAPYAWTVALWLAGPVWLDVKARRYSRAMWIAVVALSVYGSWCFASAIASSSPANGLRDFTAERALFLGLVFAWLRAAQASPWLRSNCGRRFLIFVGSLMALSAAIGLVDLMAGPGLRDWFAAQRLIFVESPEAHFVLPHRRLLFPMRDFNRVAFLGLVALMVLFVGQFRANKKTRLDRWGLLFGLPAFVVIFLSYTRGAILAAVAAFAVWCALVSRRLLIALVVAAVVGVFFLSPEKRYYILTAFRPSTYAPESGSLTSMSQRFLAWRWAAGQMLVHPVLGFGYGEAKTREQYDHYVASHDTPENRAVVRSGHVIHHMHNLWLETAVESGLPALLALLAFTLARWVLLARYYARSARGVVRRRAAAWIALEFALLLFGMIFYMLKDSYALLYWGVWAYCLSEADAAVRAAPETGVDVAGEAA